MTQSRIAAMFREGRVLIILGLSAFLFLSACAGSLPLREADYPIDCKKDQPVKDLLRRGDVHRNFLIRDKSADNIEPERWTQIRGIQAVRARICYQIVLDAKPDHSYALLNMGFTHMVESSFPSLAPALREKSLVTATNYVQQALDARRLDAQAYYYLGEIAARRDQCDKAIRVFNALLSSRWSNSQVYAWLGYCEERTGKYKEAREAYKKAAELANPIDIGEWAKSRVR